MGEVAENLQSFLYQKTNALNKNIDKLEISPALAGGASVPALIHLLVSATPTKLYIDLQTNSGTTSLVGYSRNSLSRSPPAQFV